MASRLLAGKERGDTGHRFIQDNKITIIIMFRIMTVTIICLVSIGIARGNRY